MRLLSKNWHNHAAATAYCGDKPAWLLILLVSQFQVLLDQMAGDHENRNPTDIARSYPVSTFVFAARPPATHDKDEAALSFHPTPLTGSPVQVDLANQLYDPLGMFFKSWHGRHSVGSRADSDVDLMLALTEHMSCMSH